MRTSALVALLVLAIGTLVALPAAASGSTPLEGADEGTFVLWGDQVDRMFQEPAETGDQFTRRVMQRMRRFTRDTSYEASGSMCSDKDGRLGIMILTWHAHFSAPDLGGCPIQTPNKGDFIHTHPLPGKYSLTAQDVKSINRGRRFFRVSINSTMHVSASAADKFSPDDYAVGPGYLISDAKVFYQNGKHTSRPVLTLPPLP